MNLDTPVQGDLASVLVDSSCDELKGTSLKIKSQSIFKSTSDLVSSI